MMKISFVDLFDSYLRGTGIGGANLLDMTPLSQSQFEGGGYELIGDPSDFHSYEKQCLASYHGRHVHVLFKRYFLARSEVGDGITVGAGVRLISLLRVYKKIKQIDSIRSGNIEFYLSSDRKDGAVIFDGSTVARFGQRDRRGGYSVLTLESDVDKSGRIKDMATGAVKSIMELCKINSLDLKRLGPSSFRRLVDYYCHS